MDGGNLLQPEEKKSELQNAEGRKLEQQMGDSVDSATIQHGIASWTWRESWDDWGAWDWCPSSESTRKEQSWVSLTSGKKWTIPISPIVLPSGGAAVARWRHWVKQHSGREKSGLLCVSAYIMPATSRDAALQAWGNPSFYCPPGRQAWAGQTVTTQAHSGLCLVFQAINLKALAMYKGPVIWNPTQCSTHLA